jgi:cytochrome oxidase Cu insertion factor (SCO1/SenC/PrrC family)
VARVQFVDDYGRQRSLSELAGQPMILVPMYTKCQSTCIRVTAGLKRGLGGASASANDYRVVLFSFDPSETPKSLSEFRQRERVPLSWTLATASRDDVSRLMESINFQYQTARGEFVPPNLLVVLDRELVTSKYLFGTNYSGRDLDRAFAIARGTPDWLRSAAQYGFAILIFLCTSSIVYLGYLVTRLREVRQAG